MQATLLYPHQLFKNHSALHPGRDVILIEEPLMMGEFPIHRHKLLFHRLSMQAYRAQLEQDGYRVVYFSRTNFATTAQIFAQIAGSGYTKLHSIDTVDDWLEQRMSKAAKEHGFELFRYESPLFILSAHEARKRYTKSGKHMARFYKSLRSDKNILMDGDAPLGGKWSYDEENRKKIPQGHTLPQEISCYSNDEVEQALGWLDSFEGERYGSAQAWLPYTHSTAQEWYEAFLSERFALFGDFEDAIEIEGVRMYHSAISALLNVGLLEPMQVIERAIEYAQEHKVPVNSLEGFVRQIIGWREFIRASYVVDGRAMRTRNFLRHQYSMPQSFWKGATGIDPVDDAINKALNYGYNHHIERLMVLGNTMLLSEIHPDEVYKWFMAMYVDAYDWVMVPNVYGMSQFADGGIFATKPYIAGANYIRKMSSYSKGEWEATLTGLYWNFILQNRALFESNHRMSMMPRLWDKMNQATQDAHIARARKFLKQTKSDFEEERE